MSTGSADFDGTVEGLMLWLSENTPPWTRVSITTYGHAPVSADFIEYDADRGTVTIS